MRLNQPSTPAMFLPHIRDLLGRMEQQTDAFDKAATAMADALAESGLIHLYGSGHSVIPVMEAFPRYGSYVGFHPLIDPRLAWWNVLGPGGVRELLWLERTEGYAEHFLSHRPIRQGDVLVVFSHGGRNAAPVETAMYGRVRGAVIIAITSTTNLERPATHSTGKRLVDLADLVIDTGAPAEDALAEIDGWDGPVGGSSTILACAAMTELIVRTASQLAERGVRMPTFICPTREGATPAHNEKVFSAYADRVRRATLDDEPRAH